MDTPRPSRRVDPARELAVSAASETGTAAVRICPTSSPTAEAERADVPCARPGQCQYRDVGRCGRAALVRGCPRQDSNLPQRSMWLILRPA
jgi:hypothetical protein